MNIKKFDNKKVKIIDNINDEYEGICKFNNIEYNFHEFGIDEESLQILNIIFYKSNIKKVKEIKNYSNNYSKLEEIISEDKDLLEDVLEDDEIDEEQKLRIISYLKEKNKDQ